MKRIALSIVLIAGAASLVVRGTGAFFSDVATSTGNTFTAGTLDLKANNADSVTQTYDLANMKPGDFNLATLANNVTPGQIILKNAGTIPGHLWYEIKNVNNRENGCNSSELAAGDVAPCDDSTPNEGELGTFVKAILVRNAPPYPAPTFPAVPTTINAAEGVHIDMVDLQPGDTIPIVVYGTWTPTATDNLGQGDSVQYDVVFHLDQIP